MRGLPANCQSCGHEFMVANMISGNLPQVHIKNCGTNCPKCGGYASIGEGNYNLNPEETSINSAPKSTYDILARLKSLQDTVKRASSIKVERVVAEAGLDGTKAGDTLVKFGNSAGVGKLLTILILIFTVAVQNGDFDLNEAFDQILIAIHAVDPQGAEELINLHNGSRDKSDTPHADEDNKGDVEAKPPEPSQEQLDQQQRQSEARKKHQGRKFAERSFRSPDQRPKSKPIH